MQWTLTSVNGKCTFVVATAEFTSTALKLINSSSYHINITYEYL